MTPEEVQMYPPSQPSTLDFDPVTTGNADASSAICGIGGDLIHPILPTSRILINGILTHPVGLELAMSLARTCGVQEIVGIAIIDNKNLHSEVLSRPAYLLRHLPGFRLHMIKPPVTEMDLKGVFISLRPTHVIDLETTSFSSQFFQPDMPPIFAMRNGIIFLENMLKAIVRYHSSHPNVAPPHFLRVTSEETITPPALFSHAHHLIYRIMLSTYTSLYNVQCTHLNLPRIFGPFSEGAPWMQSDMDTTAATRTSVSTTLIHVTDSVRAIMTAMAKRTSNQNHSIHSSLEVAKRHTTTMAHLSQAMIDLSSNATTEMRGRVHDSLRFVLSWYYKREYPYNKQTSNVLWGSAIEFTNNKLMHNQTDGISELHLRRNKLFPCSSECGALVPCIKSSFDSILSVSQNVTLDCRFVVYVANFTRGLDDLVELSTEQGRNNSSDWARERKLCQVAFVSAKSKLVTSLVAKQTVYVANPTSSWNGQLTHKGWTLVWVMDHDADTLTEADYMLAKIAPGSLFSAAVEKLFYMEPALFISLPPLKVIWYVMTKGMDVGSRRVGFFSTAEQKWIDPTPGRHVAFFAHNFQLPEEVSEANSLDTMTKFILKQKGLQAEHMWPHRQLEFYEDIYQLSGGRFSFEWIDTFLLIHNVQSKRSRLLRCQWYEEHLFWSEGAGSQSLPKREGRNRNLEELSLAFTIGKGRMEGKMVPGAIGWGDRIVDPSLGDTREESTTQTEYFLRLHKPMKARRTYTE
jgi:hypothetical protein